MKKTGAGIIHIVSVSFGVASVVAADIVIQRQGRENVVLWFADTCWEDEDLYRFKHDCLNRWGGDVVLSQGNRRPPDIWVEERIVPNRSVCPCSRVLKIEPFKKFLTGFFYKPVIVHLGMDWGDERRGRCASPRRNYEKLSGVIVHYPLLDMPEFDLFAEVQSWGIRPPRMYAMGFPHNNCGGRCPRQGKREWIRLREHFPERFEEMLIWENWARSQNDARMNRAFLKSRRGGRVSPLPLCLLE